MGLPDEEAASTPGEIVGRPFKLSGTEQDSKLERPIKKT